MAETKVMALREAINLAQSEEMRKDEKVFLMGEDVGIYGGDFGTSVGMLDEFGPKRVRDTPISEAAIAGSAVGAAPEISPSTKFPLDSAWIMMDMWFNLALMWRL